MKFGFRVLGVLGIFLVGGQAAQTESAFADHHGHHPDVWVDEDSDGVPAAEDQDDNDPRVCKDDDLDGCDDCSITGPDFSGGDTLNDGFDYNDDGVCDPRDTDGDGTPDNVDIDDDNDGILDVVETRVDTDGDGVVDSLDLDSDDDGILDAVEAGHTIGDSNGDGIVDCAGGFGANGFCDALETTPESGVPVYFPGSNGPDAPVDTDLDTVPDFRDLDSDDDGLLDVIEGASGCTDLPVNGVCDDADTDGDGIVDDLDNLIGHGNVGHPAAPDFDGDSAADFRDLDSDDDGLLDVEESEHADLDANGDGLVDGVDSDGDGIIDVIDDEVGHGGAPDSTVDLDNDGRPDHLDLEDGVDGVDEGTELAGLAGGAGCSAGGNSLGGIGFIVVLMLLLAFRRQTLDA